MWSKSLPKTLRFPGGYVVKVVTAPRPSAALDHDDDADYNTNERQITLWEGLTSRQRWRKLAHEYVHAWVDWQLWIENRTDGGSK